MSKEEKKYYTKDGQEIPKNQVVELDEEGYVVLSQKLIIIDFSKYNQGIDPHEQHNK